MAIESVGYAETMMTDVQYARMMPRVGAGVMSVNDFESFRVTAAAGTRTVRVAPGAASAHGVFDTSDAAVNVVLGDVTSGVRYDLIVLRRTWATKTTSIVAIPGGPTKALPSRNTTPGVVFDQPLALARVAAGSTLIQEIADLRVSVANGGAVAWDDLVRTYLTDLGTTIRIGDVAWYRLTNAAGAAIWASDDMTDTGWTAFTPGPGWVGAPGIPNLVRRVGKVVVLRGGVQSGPGGTGDARNFAQVPAPFRPSAQVQLGVAHSGYGGGFFGELFLSPTGVISAVQPYYSNNMGPGSILPLHGTWFVD